MYLAIHPITKASIIKNETEISSRFLKINLLFKKLT